MNHIINANCFKFIFAESTPNLIHAVASLKLKRDSQLALCKSRHVLAKLLEILAAAEKTVGARSGSFPSELKEAEIRENERLFIALRRS